MGGVFLKQNTALALAGAMAGAVNGLFGAGGGMILVPLLTGLVKLGEDSVFPASVSIILPICLVSLGVTLFTGELPWHQSVPWLLGSTAGGFCAGLWGGRIPVKWLHRGLGVLILWGGIRYLC